MKLQEEWIRFLLFLDRIYRIDGIFFVYGERPFGRRPFYPDDPACPVKSFLLLFHWGLIFFFT